MRPARLVLAALTLWVSTAALAADEGTVRRMIMVIEYIAGDYGAAVQNGQIASPEEYQEMIDFAESAEREFAKIEPELSEATRAEVRSNLAKLKLLIDQKADQSVVRAVVKTVKDRVVEAATFATAPQAAPSRDVALSTYSQYCASCHGETGLGDGPAAQGMEPPPRNFHETDVMVVGSPFKFYNTLEIGVDGTAMTSFKAPLSDVERWSLSFLMSAFRFGGPAPAGAQLPDDLAARLTPAGLSLERLAKANDLDLIEWLKTAAGMGQTDAENTLALLRTTAPYDPRTPISSAALAEASGVDGTERALTPDQRYELISRLVRSAREKFAQNDGATAEALLLDAYLQGFEGLETALAVSDKGMVGKVEQAFMSARAAARVGDAKAFEAKVAELELLVAETRSKLARGETSASDAAGEFLAGAVIILREGFEAFLIIAALLALLTNSGRAAAKRWIHVGWISAVVAGFATYYAFTWVFQLSGAGRETVEAVSTGLAAVVLFYVSFWLLNQRERIKWDSYIKSSAKSSAATQGGIGTLFFLAFIAVYREAAETVLFYQALSSSAASQAAVWFGFGVGATLLFVACYGIMKFGLRLPLRKFFLITSSLMIVIAIMLAGKAVYELVEAGYLKPTEIPSFPRLDVLGIYPIWESLAVQLAALALTFVLLFLSAQRRAAQAKAAS